MLRRRRGSSGGWPLGILGNKAWVHIGIKHSFFFFCQNRAGRLVVGRIMKPMSPLVKRHRLNHWGSSWNKVFLKLGFLEELP